MTLDSTRISGIPYCPVVPIVANILSLFPGALNALVVVRGGIFPAVTPKSLWPPEWRHQEWKMGEVVYARWLRGSFYRGRIRDENGNGTYSVLFDDGDVQQSVHPVDLRKHNPVPAAVAAATGTSEEEEDHTWEDDDRHEEPPHYNASNPVARAFISRAEEENATDESDVENEDLADGSGTRTRTLSTSRTIIRGIPWRPPPPNRQLQA